LLRSVAPKADGIVFVSQSLASQYEARGVKHRRLWVVPGGVDTSRFHPAGAEERQTARDVVRTYLPASASAGGVLLFVGRVVPEKGVDVLVSACQKLARRQVDFCCLVVGPSDSTAGGREYVRRCEREIADSGLSNRVVLVGPVTEDILPFLYRAADILVLPSKWAEPAAIVIAEAMASGVVVVASRVGGLPERIDDGNTGLLFEPRNSQALATILDDLLADRTKVVRISDEARKKAVLDFGIDSMTTRHLSIYLDLSATSPDLSFKVGQNARGE